MIEVCIVCETCFAERRMSYRERYYAPEPVVPGLPRSPTQWSPPPSRSDADVGPSPWGPSPEGGFGYDLERGGGVCYFSGCGKEHFNGVGQWAKPLKLCLACGVCLCKKHSTKISRCISCKTRHSGRFCDDHAMHCCTSPGAKAGVFNGCVCLNKGVRMNLKDKRFYCPEHMQMATNAPGLNGSEPLEASQAVVGAKSSSHALSAGVRPDSLVTRAGHEGDCASFRDSGKVVPTSKLLAIGPISPSRESRKPQPEVINHKAMVLHDEGNASFKTIRGGQLPPSSDTFASTNPFASNNPFSSSDENDGAPTANLVQGGLQQQDSAPLIDWK